MYIAIILELQKSQNDFVTSCFPVRERTISNLSVRTESYSDEDEGIVPLSIFQHMNEIKQALPNVRFHSDKAFPVNTEAGSEQPTGVAEDHLDYFHDSKNTTLVRFPWRIKDVYLAKFPFPSEG